MISTLDILLQKPNSRSIKAVNVVSFGIGAIETCETLIRQGGYSAEYDVNQDGYIDREDYDAIYHMFYDRWDYWEQGNAGHGVIDIRMLIHIKKCVANGNFEADYDLDNDGIITEQDEKICRRWLLYGKTEAANFE